MIGLALLLAVMAQRAPPPVIITTTPPSVEPNSETQPDAARMAAASKLIESLNLDEQYDSAFGQLLPIMTQQIFSSIRNDSTVDPAVRSYLADDKNLAAAQRLFAAEVSSGFKARYASLRAATAAEYARAFSVEELAGLAAFYASPLGQKTLRVQPALQQRLFPIGANAGREVGAEALRKTLEKLLPGEQSPQA